MAEEYILKVKTVLDKEDVQEMEDNLNLRFTRVANKFGRAMYAGIKRLAVSGILTAAMGAILSDIDKLNNAIDETLDKYKDIQDKARGTLLSPGEFYKLDQLFKVAGVNNFEGMFNAFRQQMEQTNRGMPTPLMEFKGQAANAETFLQLISSLQAAPREVQMPLAQQIFGNNQADISRILTTNFASLSEAMFKGISTEGLDLAVARGSAMAQEQMINDFRREVWNLTNRGNVISGGLLSQQDQYLRNKEAITTAQIKDQYQYAAEVQTAMLEAQNKTVELSGSLVEIVKNFWKDAKQRWTETNDIAERYRRGEITAEEADKLTFGDVFK